MAKPLHVKWDVFDTDSDVRKKECEEKVNHPNSFYSMYHCDSSVQKCFCSHVQTRETRGNTLPTRTFASDKEIVHDTLNDEATTTFHLFYNKQTVDDCNSTHGLGNKLEPY